MLLEAKDDGGNAEPMTQIDSLKPKLVGLRPIVGETKEWMADNKIKFNDSKTAALVVYAS